MLVSSVMCHCPKDLLVSSPVLTYVQEGKDVLKHSGQKSSSTLTPIYGRVRDPNAHWVSLLEKVGWMSLEFLIASTKLRQISGEICDDPALVPATHG